MNHKSRKELEIKINKEILFAISKIEEQKTNLEEELMFGSSVLGYINVKNEKKMVANLTTSKITLIFDNYELKKIINKNDFVITKQIITKGKKRIIIKTNESKIEIKEGNNNIKIKLKEGDKEKTNYIKVDYNNKNIYETLDIEELIKKYFQPVL